MKMCFTGDSIMISPPNESYWEDNKLQCIINSCEVKSTNLEMVLSGDRAFASTFCGGYWITASSERIFDLQNFGFDHYAISNNHTMDFSYLGLKQTLEVLDREGVLHSGAGKDLQSANSAVYLQCNGKKIAFITCTASCDDAARAGNSSPSIPGRPGVNMLRHSEMLYVTPEQMQTIDEIAEQTCVNARFMKAVRMGIHSLPKEIHRLGRLQFVVGEKTEKRTYCHKGDLARITQEVRKASGVADYVIVSIHSHDIRGMTDDTPDYYVEEFAHACIDAGASAIIGTGTHQLKAIEIYKNAPIFYSLGNFLFVSEHMDYAPADYYERYGADFSVSLDEIWLKRSKNNTVGLEFDPANYFSIVPILTFENGKINELELIPIELGFNNEKRQKGFPYIANEEERDGIYRRLCELSAEYGTKMKIEGNSLKVIV